MEAARSRAGESMKKVLIICPHFPPVNAADMHRVRQSLPYFRELGWTPVVLAVEDEFIEAYSMDPLLLKTVPDDIEVHKVRAWKVERTRKLGLGSLGMRAYFQMQKKGDALLAKGKFDLIYFSTTAFHLMALGPRWKRKFGVPFILDIQDPWRNDFYLDKPAAERPPKFFIAYNIDKYLEARTVPAADGIISVSKGYCDTFAGRYPGFKQDKCLVLPFGAAALDFEIMQKYVDSSAAVSLPPDKINIVYIGRGGHDMRFALEIIFRGFALGLQSDPALFSRMHFWFIGTSYAMAGTGAQTMLPVAEEQGVAAYVTEIPDRISYFGTLFLLKKANILLVPGSTDTQYTASKIYPYILAEKPLLAVFHQQSSVLKVLQEIGYGRTVAFENSGDRMDEYVKQFLVHLQALASGDSRVKFDNDVFMPYTAKARTVEQVNFFNKIIAAYAS